MTTLDIDPRPYGMCCRKGFDQLVSPHHTLFSHQIFIFFRLDALALSVIATATWLAGWLAGCLSQPVLYQND